MCNDQSSAKTPRPAATEPAGYVPAVGGADGQEDPAPEAVLTSVALPVAASPVDTPAHEEPPGPMVR